MINYTERIRLLMRDIVARVPRLSHVDVDALLVFARHGRVGANGAFATCHCLSLPPSEPGYYYWCDRASGRITRRSPWFVTRSPVVEYGRRQVTYLVSFALPRFCEQALSRSRKAQYYDRAPDWIAKLDTIVHELYHIDPEALGIRRVERHDGACAQASHGPSFLRTVADMVREYLATRPDPERVDFLRHGFADLERHHGGVLGTTFRNYPSFPQRYVEPLPDDQQLSGPPARLEPLVMPSRQTRFDDHDLVMRRFFERSTVAIRRSVPHPM